MTEWETGVIFIVSSCWMSGTVCTPPVCTINRLHVARRPCRPSTGAARTQRSTSPGFTAGHVGNARDRRSAESWARSASVSGGVRSAGDGNTKLFSEPKTESAGSDLRAWPRNSSEQNGSLGLEEPSAGRHQVVNRKTRSTSTFSGISLRRFRLPVCNLRPGLIWMLPVTCWAPPSK